MSSPLKQNPIRDTFADDVRSLPPRAVRISMPLTTRGEAASGNFGRYRIVEEARSPFEAGDAEHLWQNLHVPVEVLLDRGPISLLGAQAIGVEGTEKRIDTIAMAIQMQGTVFDLEEAELCYAPQFGSAKDPVNMAGMIAANVIRGDLVSAHWEDLASSDSLVVDVREPDEFAAGHVEGSINVPLSQLRERIHQLPKDRTIAVYCRVGQRSYYAMRILAQHGYRGAACPEGLRAIHACRRGHESQKQHPSFNRGKRDAAL